MEAKYLIETLVICNEVPNLRRSFSLSSQLLLIGRKLGFEKVGIHPQGKGNKGENQINSITKMRSRDKAKGGTESKGVEL
jgi:hypothetical protein